MIYLDTHVAAWLFAGRRDLLSAEAARRIESEDLVVSPMVVLELEYLREVGRTTAGGGEVIRDLRARIGLKVCEGGFPLVVDTALSQGWTRDPFDRLIVAQARASDLPLLTRDDIIHQHYPGAVW